MKQLADGTSMRYGTLESGLKWQSSGTLVAGATAPGPQFIHECYELKLAEDPAAELDPNPKFLSAPRQRIEFRSPVDAEDGTPWHFTWKSLYPSTLKTSKTFFHLMQIFSRKDSLPTFTLDIVKGEAAIKNSMAKTTLQSIPLTAFFDRALIHDVKLIVGSAGRFEYTVADAISGEVLMYVCENAYTGTGGVYLKFGTYRMTYEGMGPSQAWCGDYTCEQIA